MYMHINLICLLDLILKLIPRYSILIHHMSLVHQCDDCRNLIVMNYTYSRRLLREIQLWHVLVRRLEVVETSTFATVQLLGEEWPIIIVLLLAVRFSIIQRLRIWWAHEFERMKGRETRGGKSLKTLSNRSNHWNWSYMSHLSIIIRFWPFRLVQTLHIDLLLDRYIPPVPSNIPRHDKSYLNILQSLNNKNIFLNILLNIF